MYLTNKSNRYDGDLSDLLKLLPFSSFSSRVLIAVLTFLFLLGIVISQPKSNEELVENATNAMTRLIAEKTLSDEYVWLILSNWRTDVIGSIEDDVFCKAILGKYSYGCRFQVMSKVSTVLQAQLEASSASLEGHFRAFYSDPQELRRLYAAKKNVMLKAFHSKEFSLRTIRYQQLEAAVVGMHAFVAEGKTYDLHYAFLYAEHLENDTRHLKRMLHEAFEYRGIDGNIDIALKSLSFVARRADPKEGGRELAKAYYEIANDFFTAIGAVRGH